MISMNEAARVLIVDDEPSVRLVFRTTLESSGYDVSEASDGQAALDLIQEREFDVVLLDLRMPQLGGMEILERLRAVDSEIPVAMITAHGSIPDVVSALRLGAVDFIAKPLSPEKLREAVRRVALMRVRRVLPALSNEPRERREMGSYRVAGQLTWG
jgi:DNA-binding NtrC family response regulator